MRKKEYAVGICVMSLVTIGLIAAGIGNIEWTVAKIYRHNTSNPDCVVTRRIGLFNLQDTSSSCSREIKEGYNVYNEKIVQFNHAIQYCVTAFCGVSIVASLIVLAVAAFNICGNPYETFCSAIGLIVYNAIGLVASLIAVILYTVLLYTDLEEPLLDETPIDSPSNVYRDEDYYLKSPAYFGYSFFLVVVSILTYVLGIVLTVLSERDTVEKIRKIISPPKEENNDQKMQDIMSY